MDTPCRLFLAGASLLKELADKRPAGLCSARYNNYRNSLLSISDFLKQNNEMWAMTLLYFEGNTQFYTIYGRESFLHLCIMVEDPFFRYQTAFKYFFCLLAMQRRRVFTRSLPWSKALFINLSCHHGRYCPVVDHKSVLPTGHAHEHSCESNLTPTDAWHREHILNSSCNKTQPYAASIRLIYYERIKHSF